MELSWLVREGESQNAKSYVRLFKVQTRSNESCKWKSALFLNLLLEGTLFWLHTHTYLITVMNCALHLISVGLHCTPALLAGNLASIRGMRASVGSSTGPSGVYLADFHAILAKVSAMWSVQIREMRALQLGIERRFYTSDTTLNAMCMCD